MLLSIGEWWSGLYGVGGAGSYLQVLYVVAITVSLIMLLQLILALFGIGHGADADFDLGGGADAGGDFDGGGGDIGAGIRIFTVQGIVSFFVMYSWSAIGMLSSGMPAWLASIIGVILGAVMMLVMAKMMQLMMKLQSSGNIELEGAVGTLAQVYIPIPPDESGIGKVTMTYQSRFIECNAITRGAELLKTDAFVRVAEVRGTTLVVVKADPSEINEAKTEDNGDNGVRPKKKRKWRFF